MILLGDCRVRLAELAPDSVDSVVTDPPYDLTTGKKGGTGAASLNLNSPAGRSRIGTGGGFMGLGWDATGVAFDPATWAAVFRVLKPGGHLLAFGGTRTHHRMVCAIEDAGFDIRDELQWLYGSGFPKSLDVSKAIDKAAGAERSVIGPRASNRPNVVGLKPGGSMGGGTYTERLDTIPSTDNAIQWEGWGTALKPAAEIICLAQKPRTEEGERGIIVENLNTLEAQLWSLLPARIAAENFRLSPSEFDAACASARWSAAEKNSTRDDLSGLMDTSRFVSGTITSLSIVSSWRSTLDALLNHGSTSTTETKSSQITDLKILKSCLSGLTPHAIIRAATNQHGLTLGALPAVRAFAAVDARLSATLDLSAIADAISRAPTLLPEGTGKALSPACESICLARKPFAGTVAANVLEHGTGALNIDGCRIAGDEDGSRNRPASRLAGANTYAQDEWTRNTVVQRQDTTGKGRWPANVILSCYCEDEADHGDGCPIRILDEQTGDLGVSSGGGMKRDGNRPTSYEITGHQKVKNVGLGDSGGASRFYYIAKPSKAERGADNDHPTVKPVDLLRYLIRLVTPPGGIVLDPFAGSGTTCLAAQEEGFRWIACELLEKHVEIIRRRTAQNTIFGGAA